MRRWTAAEIDYLRTMAGLKPTSEIAKTLGRNPRMIRDKCCRTGIKLGPRRWTRKEEAKLISLKGTMTHAEIGKIMGRSRAAITQRSCELALTERNVYWTEEDSKRLIRLNHLGWSDYDISMKMGKDRTTIHRHRKILGLPAVTNKNGSRISERHRRKISAANRRWHRMKRMENRL